ncbi:MAG TPA: histidinol-phosphate transaminase [Bacilli bacterium]
MKPKEEIVHLPVYQPGKPIEEVKRELGLEDITKMASNENPYGCSPKVQEAVISKLNYTHIYPDGASTELTQALSKFHNVEENQLIFGAGSDEVILMIARAFLVRGDETIMAEQTFPQYRHNAVIEGAVCLEVPLKAGTHDLQGMLNKVTDKTKVIWVCNPNNPTGTMVTHQEIKQFIESVPSHVLIVLDEAYYEYNVSSNYPDSLGLLQEHKNIVLLRTFSKIYGLASLRIGFGIGHPEIIRYINQVREPFNTTTFAQAAAVAALQDQEFIEHCKKQNAEGITYLTSEFTGMDLTYFPAHGNFIMLHLNRPAELVFDALLRKGIIVRGGHKLGFPASIRVTVGTPQQNTKFIETLKSVLSEISVLV